MWRSITHIFTYEHTGDEIVCIFQRKELHVALNPTSIYYTYIYVSLQLRVQNRRGKWHFPLNFRNGIIWTSPFPPNIRNAINWAGATSKAFSSSEALISVLSKNARLYDNTVHCTYIQMVTSGYQFMNLKFVHLSKNMPTEHQHLVMVLAYRKYCRRRSSIPLGLAKETISVLRNFCHHPWKGW